MKNGVCSKWSLKILVLALQTYTDKGQANNRRYSVGLYTYTYFLLFSNQGALSCIVRLFLIVKRIEPKLDYKYVSKQYGQKEQTLGVKCKQ